MKEWGGSGYQMQTGGKAPGDSGKPSLPMGWICPRCERVHAPSVLTCSCQPKKPGPLETKG